MPPAFALSQDQTLRFISAVRLPDLPKRTDPTRFPVSAHRARTSSKHNCSRICRRYVEQSPSSMRRASQSTRSLRTPQAAWLSARPRGAANVSLPSGFTCQRTTRNPPAFPCGPTARSAPTRPPTRGRSATLMEPPGQIKRNHPARWRPFRRLRLRGQPLIGAEFVQLLQGARIAGQERRLRQREARKAPVLRGSAGSNSLAHLLERNRSPSAFDVAAQSRGRKLRQQDHAAVRMHKELHPISRLQPEMELCAKLGDGGVSEAAYRGG